MNFIIVYPIKTPTMPPICPVSCQTSGMNFKRSMKILIIVKMKRNLSKEGRNCASAMHDIYLASSSLFSHLMLGLRTHLQHQERVIVCIYIYLCIHMQYFN